MNISVVGLGKLGSCMAAVYASKGHTVVGIDLNQKYVDAFNNHQAPVQEKDLAEYIERYGERLKGTTEYSSAIAESVMTFIIVPTPTDETGAFSVKYIQEAVKQIGQCLKTKNDYHLIVVTSTVLPGDCQDQIIPFLEEYSGKRCGQDFGFCYSPEFIAIGSVIKDLLNPDFFLIGEYDQRSGEVLEQFYQTIPDNKPAVKRMSIPSAELAKISLNSYLTMKITYANMLTELAEHIPGVNVDSVTDAIGNDKRIGKQYLKGGLSYGGPCFPRDNRAFAVMAKKRGVEVPYAEATDSYNKHSIERAVKHIRALSQPTSKIGIFGLAYKPGTHFAEESPGVLIAKSLQQLQYSLLVYEPEGYSHAEGLLGQTLEYSSSLKEAVDKSDVILVTYPHTQFSTIPTLVKEQHTKKIIIDPWRLFNPADFGELIHYFPFGIGL